MLSPASSPLVPSSASRRSPLNTNGSSDSLQPWERNLATALNTAGYPVLNVVSSKSIGDPALLKSVLSAFAGHFPELRP